MKRPYTAEELLHKAAAYCSAAEHCIAEVDEKLRKWEAGGELREQIIDRLTADGFIDESRYAEAFVRDKFRFNKWGKTKIAFALKAKGVPSEDIQAALTLIDDEAYEAALTALVQSKLGGLNYADDYEKHGKLFRFAQSRGFESRVIERVLREIG